MYTYPRKVTYSEVAADGLVDAAQTICYFQDCSTLQSESLGMGIRFLSEHEHVWLLTSWQVDFYRRPGLGEDVVSVTWPYGFDAMYGYRNFLLKSSGGEVLAAAASQWILVNVKTGRPERLTPEFTDGYVCEEKYAMDYAPRRIRLPSEWEDKMPFPVRRADLDTNGHVNNSRYIAMAMEYPEEGEIVRRLRVEYKKSAVYGDMIYPRVHRRDGVITVTLCDGSHQVYASVEITC